MSNLDNLTLKDIKCLTTLITPHSEKQDDSHWIINEKYFIRTVTHHFTGLLIKITHQELILTECCWIPEDGRFMQAMQGKGFEEQEPYPAKSQIIIGRGSLIDAFIIDFNLPAEQKG